MKQVLTLPAQLRQLDHTYSTIYTSERQRRAWSFVDILFHFDNLIQTIIFFCKRQLFGLPKCSKRPKLLQYRITQADETTMMMMFHRLPVAQHTHGQPQNT